MCFMEIQGPTTDDVDFKGSSDPSHFIFEINVGKGRIRHRTTPNLNKVNFGFFFQR